MPLPATNGQFRSKLSDMQIGDYIAAKYTVAASGAAGVFSELGAELATAQANEIPVTAAAVPNGYIYFIKVDTGLLIADRVVQHSVSWETLNAARYIQGLQVKSVVPTMTALTQNGYTIAASSSFGTGYEAWRAFNNVDEAEGWASSNNTLPAWISITSSGTMPDIKSYSIKSGTATVNLTEFPTKWDFQGTLNGIDYVTLDSQTGVSWYTTLQEKTFNLATVASGYKGFRLYITATGGGPYIAVNQLDLIPSIGRYLLRSLSGGVAYLGANGLSSNTDTSLGAWPPNNEWDSYIVRSTLNDKILAGSDSVWHWSSVATWTQDTPIVALKPSDYKLCRGGAAVNKLDISRQAGGVSSLMGFRPVLQYIDNDKQTNLWY